MKYSMKYRLFVFMLALVLGNAFIISPSAKAQLTENPFVRTVTGTVEGQPFTGTLEITRFLVRGGQLFAVGLLTIPDTRIQNTRVLLPVDPVFGSSGEVSVLQATCEVLFLEIEGITLRLLGLIVASLKRCHWNRYCQDEDTKCRQYVGICRIMQYLNSRRDGCI